MVKICRATFASFPAGLIFALVMAIGFCLSANRVMSGDHTEAPDSSTVGQQPKLDFRKFTPYENDRWIGQGISYGPFRVGQAPGQAYPSLAEISEDLHILAKHWRLIRIYGADQAAEDILYTIRQENIPIKVMLGAWITRETFDDAADNATAEAAKLSNRSHVDGVIRLANEYSSEVVAVCVGNETQVYWSDHIIKVDRLIEYIREVREAVRQPVTTADDFNFWNKPESKAVAAEIDFLVLHVHALWAGALPDDALQWTKKVFAEIAAFHPGRTIVIGEAGWATQVHDEGEQAELIKGEASEATQSRYYREFTEWAGNEKICSFFFEAFDEPWKGGNHPHEVEKHWGLFRVDRTPKAAMKGGR